MSDSITIHQPTMLEFDETTRLNSSLRFDGEKRDMWYEIPSSYAHWLSTDRSDGFVVGFILQAMRMRKDIITEAPMSSKLWHNLTQFFVPMMAKSFPELHAIKIRPPTLLETPKEAKGVAGGFSGGVDSFAAIVDHFVAENSPSHKISEFLFHNVGSHGDKNYKEARSLFNHRYKELEKFPDLVGVPFVPVDSNIHEVVPINFVKSYITLNASVPLVLQNQFQRYFYASSYKYEDCGVSKTDVIGRFDPIAFHLLSTETLDCVSTGGQMSRVEKTKHISSYEPSSLFLNVCVDPAYEGRNCSVCIKCCRTLLTLDLLGLADQYTQVFDLNRFNEIRRSYIRDKVENACKGEFEYEILELARDVSEEPWARRLRGREEDRIRIRGAIDFVTGAPRKLRSALKRILHS